MAKTLAHTITESTLAVYREFFRRHRNDATAVKDGSGYLEAWFTGFDLGDRDASNPGSNTPEYSSGYDYTNYMAPVAKTYNTFAERLDNFDAKFAVESIKKFYVTGGHDHSGTDGKGPHLPATSILGDLAEHMLDADAHTPAQIPSPVPAAFFDSFDRTTGYNDKWAISGGTPVRTVLADGKVVCQVGVGTTMRVIAPSQAFSDRVTLDFDIRFPSSPASGKRMEVHLRGRYTSPSSSRYMFGVSSANPPGSSIYTYADPSTCTQVSGADTLYVPDDHAWHHVRILMYGTSLRLWIDDMLSSATNGTVATVYGDIELRANGCTYQIDNFSVHRCTVVDVLDVTDYVGTLRGGNSPYPHKERHGAGNSDALEVSYLVDRQKRLLTAAEKAQLYPNGTMHKHTDKAISLRPSGYPAPIGSSSVTSVDKHVQDAALHSRSQNAPRIHPLPLMIPPHRSPEHGGYSIEYAAADHFHTRPYWYRETLRHDNPGWNINLLRNRSFEALGDWEIGGGAVKTNLTPYDGTYCVDLPRTLSYVRQRKVPIENGQAYNFSYFFMQDTSASWIHEEYEWYNGATLVRKDVTVSHQGTVLGSGVYQLCSATVTAPANADRVDIAVVKDQGNSDTWRIDYMTLAKEQVHYCSNACFSESESNLTLGSLIPTMHGEYDEMSPGLYDTLRLGSTFYHMRIRMRTWYPGTWAQPTPYQVQFMVIPLLLGTMKVEHAYVNIHGWRTVEAVRDYGYASSWRSDAQFPNTGDLWAQLTWNWYPGYNDVTFYIYLDARSAFRFMLMPWYMVDGTPAPFFNGLYFVPVPLGADMMTYWNTFPTVPFSTESGI